MRAHCVVCGREFERTRKARTCGPGCSREWGLEYDRAYGRRYREAGRDRNVTETDPMHDVEYPEPAEIARRAAIVKRVKETAWAAGHTAPSADELTAALGDEAGVGSHTRRDERARRSRKRVSGSPLGIRARILRAFEHHARPMTRVELTAWYLNHPPPARVVYAELARMVADGVLVELGKAPRGKHDRDTYTLLGLKGWTP